jgi:hypothetical protein
MEKYARQHIAEGIQHAEQIHVDFDSEIFRVLNSHYNRNNQLEVRSFFSQIFINIYKVILNNMIFFSIDSNELCLCNRSNITGVFQSDSRGQRSRSVMEKSHLQGDCTHGRSNTRIFQIS